MDINNPRLAAGVFLCLTLFVLVVQNDKVGFEEGHHGWVSSHTLAIISHATRENGFVGYSMPNKDERGEEDPHYFDRNPVFFSAAMNFLLEAGQRSISEKVYVARQIMNVIFLLTMWFSFLLMFNLMHDRVAALSATLVTFSGYYFMYYKDMVHFEQPGLLGMILLLNSILLYGRTGRKWILYVSAVAAVSLGRGYVSLAVLGLWFLIECVGLFRTRPSTFITASKRLIGADVSKVLVLCVGLSASYVGCNVATEARVRGVSIAETSIVESATKRSGFRMRSEGWAITTGWFDYLPKLGRRLIQSAVPYAFRGMQSKFERYVVESRHLFAILIVCFGAGLFYLARRRAFTPERSFYLLLILSGFAWFIPMKGHASPHNYSAIYFAGLLLFVFGELFSFLRGKFRFAALAGAVILFVVSNVSVNQAHSKTARSANLYTFDFENMAHHLSPGAHVYVDGGYRMLLPGRPYALGFYLSSQFLTPITIAEYAVSQRREFGGRLLTPNNHAAFLFRIDEKEREKSAGRF